jgi:hypothetical protein
MKTLRAIALFALSPLSLVALIACSSNSSGDGGSTSDGGAASGDGGSTFTDGASAAADGGTTTSGGTLGALCSSTSRCGTGLTCAESGSLLGRCTADCSSNLDLCATQFGSDAVCMNEAQCALTCASAATCPGEGVCTPLSSGKSACITNPNGPPDAAPPPNGACYNLGGAFGDTVENGGYRCSFTNSQDAPTGVDLCTNGVWSSAYTCTCQVTGYDATCADFTTPGTAQCQYGVDSCAQCVPGTGCATE